MVNFVVFLSLTIVLNNLFHMKLQWSVIIYHIKMYAAAVYIV